MLGEKEFTYGIVTIVTGHKRARAERVLIYEEDEPITLDECLNIIEYEMKKDGTCVVIHETALDGKVYRYGNHGDYWEQIGKTGGYA